jgi:hypothetical protein
MAAVNRPVAIQNVIRRTLDAVVDARGGRKDDLRDDLVKECRKRLLNNKRYDDDPEGVEREQNLEWARLRAERQDEELAM